MHSQHGSISLLLDNLNQGAQLMQKVLSTADLGAVAREGAKAGARGKDEHKRVSSNTKSKLMVKACIGNALMNVRKIARLAAQ